MMRTWLLAVALSAVGYTGTADASAVEQLRAFLDEVDSLEARFEQSLYDEKRKLLESSGGTFYLQRPDRFRWSYSEPYPQEIVADGKRLWVYDSELAQVIVKPLDEALGNTPSLLLSSREPLDASFVLSEAGQAEGLDWVKLTPKGAESSFVELRLGLAGGELKTMELEDSFGQTTRLQFSDTLINPSLDPALFRFTLPTGVDVISDTKP
jgi:outer membrane lipoprotein carrier protein